MDSGSLEQVVMNIALNARDAMPHGGRLTIRTAAIVLLGHDAEWPALPPGSYAQISIEDTGTGISDDVIDRIFEPFFTTKSRGRGTGLGLATVYAIVRQAGGDISVRSQPGLGTSVALLLPASKEDAVEPALVPRDSSPSGKDETILVVEDEDGVRRVVDRILSRNGYRVLLASSGSEAIKMARTRHDIDLLLTDVIMPEMSGVRVAETLRKRKPDLRVVFMSGYPDETIAHHGVLAEAATYLQKPFTMGDLLTKVRSALESSTAQRLPSNPEA
jgi:two-component system cell cycle sensor histidine kinase/response regulator CckA